MKSLRAFALLAILSVSFSPLAVFADDAPADPVCVAPTWTGCLPLHVSSFNVEAVQNQPVTSTLSASRDDVTFTIVSAPSHGVASINGNVLTYTPDSTFTDVDTITYSAADNGGPLGVSNTGTITVNRIIPATLQVEADSGTVFSKTPVTIRPCSNTADGSTQSYNALCAFDAAGLSTSYTWFSFGAQVDSIAGVTAPGWPGNTWLFFVNGEISMVGASSYEPATDDEILWTLGVYPTKISVSNSSPVVGATTTITVLGFDINMFDFEPLAGAAIVGTDLVTGADGTVDLTATSTSALSIYATKSGYLASKSTSITATGAPAAETPTPPTSGGGGGGISHGTFNVPRALAFLSSKQNSNGSFSADLYTDWTALAFAAADPGTAKTKMRSYLQTATPSMVRTTDYERHAMALMALGIDPYNGTSVDYIAPIIARFNGTQITDPSMGSQVVQDDIFAIFPLLKAGYSSSDDVIQKITAYIISQQAGSGSFGDPDTTSAAIQALSLVPSLPNVSSALTKAQAYLHTQQQTNGGFGNTPSTSWAMLAIASLGQSEAQWAPASYYPTDYLASMQQSDGGVEPVATAVDTRVWATAYAIPSALYKTWSSLLSSFAKPTTASSGGSSTNTTATSTSAIATTTPAVAAATSTPVVATSTTPVATTTSLALTIDTPDETTPKAPQARTLAVKANPATQTASIEVEDATTPDVRTQVAAAAATESGIPLWLWLIIAAFILAVFGGVAYAQFASKR